MFLTESTNDITLNTPASSNYPDHEGVYISLKVNDALRMAIDELNQIFTYSCQVPLEKHHCTLMYAENQKCPSVFLDHIQQSGKFIELGQNFLVDSYQIKKWNTKEDGAILVLEFKSKEISLLHQKLRDMYGLKHSYDDFKVHMTLSYDIGDSIDNKIEYMNNFLNQHHSSRGFGFRMISVEPLNTNWSDTVK